MYVTHIIIILREKKEQSKYDVKPSVSVQTHSRHSSARIKYAFICIIYYLYYKIYMYIRILYVHTKMPCIITIMHTALELVGCLLYMRQNYRPSLAFPLKIYNKFDLRSNWILFN